MADWRAAVQIGWLALRLLTPGTARRAVRTSCRRHRHKPAVKPRLPAALREAADEYRMRAVVKAPILRADQVRLGVAQAGHAEQVIVPLAAREALLALEPSAAVDRDIAMVGGQQVDAEVRARIERRVDRRIAVDADQQRRGIRGQGIDRSHGHRIAALAIAAADDCHRARMRRMAISMSSRSVAPGTGLALIRPPGQIVCGAPRSLPGLLCQHVGRDKAEGHGRAQGRAGAG